MTPRSAPQPPTSRHIGRAGLSTISRRTRLGTTALLGAALLVGCASPINISSAEVSIDGQRIAILFTSCGKVVSASVEETNESVTISADTSGDLVQLEGQDCLDRVVVMLGQRLGDRKVIDDATGNEVAVSGPAIAEDLVWPYDRSRISESEYEAALDRMVECLESEDPAIEAWVVDDLNWKTWDFAKERDENGHMEAPAIEKCDTTVLEPLR